MTETNEILRQLQADAMVFYQKLRAFDWTEPANGFSDSTKRSRERTTVGQTTSTRSLNAS